MIDTRALKEKAEKATPGRRSVCLDRFNSDEEWVFLVDSPEHDDLIVMVSTGEFDDALASANAQARADAEFIAAASPDVILALLAERDTAHARIAALEQAQQQFAELKLWLQGCFNAPRDSDRWTDGYYAALDHVRDRWPVTPPTSTQEPGR